ncbi:MAG: sel1 repeat family protein [Akkermansia sp.]|nr:sel1 repeat family protein [Akkermansia sp.]
MKTTLLLTVLLALPLLAEPTTPDSYSCNDERMEQSVAELKEAAEKGDAYSQRQLYLRYALKGHATQAAAWADRLIANLTEKGTDGDQKAMWMLARLFMTGDDVIPADLARSIEWFNRLSATGEPSAAFILGDLYTKQNTPEAAASAYAKAYHIYSNQAEAEDSESLYWQGYMELNGLGCTQQAEAGINNLETAASRGILAAAYQLFKVYTQGIGTAANAQKALTYATQLADQGKDAQMAYVVADAYLKGKGVEMDTAKGMQYLEKAVAGQVPAALYHRGWLFQEEGKHQDALRFYRAAAQQGHADAAVKAGSMLIFGEGVAEDSAEGLKILQYADSILESPFAPYELGRYYDRVGESALADEYYITASTRGYPAAMARRGLLHLDPTSPVTWNPTATYQWWKTGSDAGDATCTCYLRLYLFVFIPLLLIIIFGLPLYMVHHLMSKRAAQSEQE